jgi:hypothetical protein
MQHCSNWPLLLLLKQKKARVDEGSLKEAKSGKAARDPALDMAAGLWLCCFFAIFSLTFWPQFFIVSLACQVRQADVFQTELHSRA